MLGTLPVAQLSQISQNEMPEYGYSRGAIPGYTGMGGLGATGSDLGYNEFIKSRYASQFVTDYGTPWVRAVIKEFAGILAKLESYEIYGSAFPTRIFYKHPQFIPVDKNGKRPDPGVVQGVFNAIRVYMESDYGIGSGQRIFTDPAFREKLKLIKDFTVPFLTSDELKKFRLFLLYSYVPLTETQKEITAKDWQKIRNTIATKTQEEMDKVGPSWLGSIALAVYNASGPIGEALVALGKLELDILGTAWKGVQQIPKFASKVFDIVGYLPYIALGLGLIYIVPKVLTKGKGA